MIIDFLPGDLFILSAGTFSPRLHNVSLSFAFFFSLKLWGLREKITRPSSLPHNCYFRDEVMRAKISAVCLLKRSALANEVSVPKHYFFGLIIIQSLRDFLHIAYMGYITINLNLILLPPSLVPSIWEKEKNYNF